jgi:uncharacterized protein (TIGR02284 family)
MMPQKTVIPIVRELIQVHEDRVLLYHQALLGLVHPDRLDLKAFFGELIRESLEFQRELNDYLARLDGRANGVDNEHQGTIYKVWETGKVPIQGDSSKVILEACERESEAVQQAYEEAFSSGDLMDNILRRRLNIQVVKIRNLEDKIRKYHDAL